MDNCMISLIVPVYNVEKYVRKCLNSLIEQSYPALEIVCINDCSTDASGQICDEFADKDNRIRVIHKKSNEGLSEARNTGMRIAKGEYIAFIDSDDWIDSLYVERLYEAVCDNRADIAQCAYRRVANDTISVQANLQKGRGMNITGRQAIKMLFSTEVVQPSVNYTVVWNKLYRKSIVENLEFPKGAIFEDQFFTYRCFDKARKVCVLDDTLYFYRDNSSSITKQEYNIRFQDDIIAHEEQIKYFLRRKDYEMAEIVIARIEPLCINHYLRACFFELKIEKQSAYKHALKSSIKYLRNKCVPKRDKLKVLVFLLWPELFFYYKLNVDFHVEDGNDRFRAANRK